MDKFNLKNLKHSQKKTDFGGKVVLLNTGAVINAEAEAMLQALHSRSNEGIKHHLKILEEKGAERFMENFYVGYGHKSIGDCGTITLFIEGVSMLCAKAIQDFSLYSGQESSTRYIDFSKQKFIDPIGTSLSSKILENWREFYLESQEPLKKFLQEKFPIQKGENEKTYQKAISARGFDILRGFLPASASTNLAWHSNLRQVADRLLVLRHHPLAEVRETAFAIEALLLKTHKSSFSHKRYSETEKYNEFWMEKENYFFEKISDDLLLKRDCIDKKLFEKYTQILKRRPNAKTELPKFLSEAGTMQFEFTLDFGSFRDIQRHRGVAQRMPLLTDRLGFEDWYLNELPENLQKKAKKLLKDQKALIRKIKADKFTKQYYLAMGYKVPNRITGDLPALVYLVELRATRFVHPTLRRRAIQMADIISKRFKKYGLKIFLDNEPDRFDIKRGEQDIILKK